MDLGILAAFFSAEELAPGNAFRIRAAAQPAPMHGLGTDPYAVAEARHGEVAAQPHIDDVVKRPNLLSPVPRHAAADREDAQPLGPMDALSVVVEIEERIVGRHAAAKLFQALLFAGRILL